MTKILYINSNQAYFAQNAEVLQKLAGNTAQAFFSAGRNQYYKVSNRVSKSVNGIKTEYVYNNRNQLISEKTGKDTVTYDYDPNGNLINKNENGISTIYSYDDFNRMIRYTSSKEDYSYTYDAEGVRRSKIDTKTNNKTVFISDTNAAYSYTLAEISDDGSYVTYLNVGELISKDTDGNDSFYIYDGQENVRLILDESGNTVSSYQYNAYGELLDNSGDFSNRYLYCGEVCDEDSLHKYLYVNANPIGYKDPSGHTSVAEQACATAIMAVVSERYTICLAGLMGAIFGAAVSPLLKGNANAEDHMLKSMISGFIIGAGISAIGFISAAVFSISLIHFYLTVALISTTAEYVEALYCMSQGKTKEYFVHLTLSLISFVGFSKLYNMPDVFPSMGKGKISKYANAVEERGLVYKGGSESVLPSDTKPDFIVTPEGTVMDTNKNYNLVGSGEQGDWFQIHNYGKPEDGFDFPHTHKPQLNTNGTHTSYKRVVSNTTAEDIDYADELLRLGKMILRKKGRR